MASLGILALAATGGAGVQSGSWSAERFLTEAPAAWDGYRSASEALQGSVIVTRTDHTGKQPRERWRTEIRQSPANKCALIVRQELEPPTNSKGQVVAMNPRYAFALSRRTPTGPWVLTGLDTSPRWPETPVAIVSPSASVSSLVCQNLKILNVRLPDLVKEPEFSLKSTTTVERGGRQLVRVEFDRPSKVLANNPVRGGWVLLDPDRHWVAHEFEVKGEWVDGNGTIAGVASHNEADTGLLILRRYRWRQKAHSRVDGPVDFDYTFDYDLHEQRTIPLSEFTLSAFGLPEPEGVRSTWYLWVIGVGAVLVGVAAFLRVRARRAQATG